MVYFLGRRPLFFEVTLRSSAAVTLCLGWRHRQRAKVDTQNRIMKKSILILLLVAMGFGLAINFGRAQTTFIAPQVTSGRLAGGRVWLNVRGGVLSNASPGSIGLSIFYLAGTVATDASTAYLNRAGIRTNPSSFQPGDIVNVYALQSAANSTAFTARIVRNRSR